MEMIMRDYDVFTGNKDLQSLYNMKHFPVYMGVTDKEEGEDQFEDMEWMISQGSGMIQLSKLVPESILYQNSHNSSIGKVWRDHHTSFAQFVHQYADKEGAILELGGGVMGF